LSEIKESVTKKDIIKEIQECFNNTKDWDEYTNMKKYYKGCNDAYLHLLRFTAQSIRR